MSRRTAALGLLALVLAVVLVWMSVAGGQRARTGQPGTQGTAETVPDSSPTRAPAGAPVGWLPEPGGEPSRERAGSEFPESPELAPTVFELAAAREQARARVAVRGRVLDTDGNFVPGARLWSCPWERRAREVELAESGADGRFEGFLDGTQGDGSYSITAEGFAAWRGALDVGSWDARPEEVRLGDVVLEAGGVVSGLVVDEVGRPLAEAEVFAHPGSERPDPDAPRDIDGHSRSAADGRFRMVGVPLGEHVLWAHTLDAAGFGDVVEVARQRPVEVRLVLRRDPARATIRGRVVADDGRPVAGLLVSCQDIPGLSAADGGFAVACEAGAPATVHVFDPRHRFGPLERGGVAPGTQDLVLVLAPPVWLEVSLCEAAGAPIPWGHVTMTTESAVKRSVQGLRGLGYGGPSRAPGAVTIDFDARGRARCLRPEAPFSVRADAPGYRTLRLGPFDPGAVGEHLALVLEPGQLARGRVLHDGHPLAGATVDLTRDGLTEGHEGLGATPRERPFVVTRIATLDAGDGTTDAEGRFVITVHEAGRHSLRVSAPGLGHALFGPFEIDPERGLDDLELELARPGVLEGRVLVPAGVAAEGRVVGASNGNGLARTAAVDAEGRYRLDQLQPGEYQVRPCVPPVGAWQRLAPGRHVSPWIGDCRVRAGQTTAYDLDLRTEGSCRLLGRLDLGAELPPEAAWEALLFREGRVWARADLDPGRAEYEFALSDGGPYTLRLVGGSIQIEAAVELVAGETRRDIALTCGRLHVVARPPEGARFTSLLLESSSPGLELRWSCFVSSNGLDEVSLVPSGTYRWTSTDVRAQGPSQRSRLERGTIEIRVGEETELRYPE